MAVFTSAPFSWSLQPRAPQAPAGAGVMFFFPPTTILARFQPVHQISDPSSISVLLKYAPQVIQYELFLYYSDNSDINREYFSNNIEYLYCYHCSNILKYGMEG
jgi:hypothetical protein